MKNAKKCVIIKGKHEVVNMAQNKKVLIVDDDKSNLLVLMDILQRDYTISIAKEGEEAIRIAEKTSPDIILLDIILPGIDGYEVLSRLRKSDNTKNIPVIFLTGLSDSDNEEKALKCGAAGYIMKPFNPSVIKQKVKEQLAVS
jgi:putative two-component system response regulator